MLTSKYCPSAWVSVVSEHGPITVKSVPRCNLLLAEATSSSLTALISLAISFKACNKASKGRSIFLPGRLGGGIVRETYLRLEDISKVSFEFRRFAWQIRYKANVHTRKSRTSVTGLQVSTNIPDNSSLSETAVITHLKDMLSKARRMWNLMDKSDAPRLMEDRRFRDWPSLAVVALPVLACLLS